MLITNITFTKGIGTPIYMSPEVLNKEHYKSPSDIYSFSITIYECIKWEKHIQEINSNFHGKYQNL